MRIDVDGQIKWVFSCLAKDSKTAGGTQSPYKVTIQKINNESMFSPRVTGGAKKRNSSIKYRTHRGGSGAQRDHLLDEQSIDFIMLSPELDRSFLNKISS